MSIFARIYVNLTRVNLTQVLIIVNGSGTLFLLDGNTNQRAIFWLEQDGR